MYLVHDRPASPVELAVGEPVMRHAVDQVDRVGQVVEVVGADGYRLIPAAGSESSCGSSGGRAAAPEACARRGRR